jgi:hypothetical protein
MPNQKLYALRCLTDERMSLVDTLDGLRCKIANGVPRGWQLLKVDNSARMQRLLKCVQRADQVKDRLIEPLTVESENRMQPADEAGYILWCYLQHQRDERERLAAEREQHQAYERNERERIKSWHRERVESFYNFSNSP